MQSRSQPSIAAGLTAASLTAAAFAPSDAMPPAELAAESAGPSAELATELGGEPEPGAEIANLSELEAQLADCDEPLDAEEERAAEAEAVEAEQAGLAAFVDSLVVQEVICEVSGGGCGSKRPIDEMEETRDRHHWICRDRQACKLRLEAISVGGRKQAQSPGVAGGVVGRPQCAFSEVAASRQYNTV